MAFPGVLTAGLHRYVSFLLVNPIHFTSFSLSFAKVFPFLTLTSFILSSTPLSSFLLSSLLSPFLISPLLSTPVFWFILQVNHHPYLQLQPGRFQPTFNKSRKCIWYYGRNTFLFTHRTWDHELTRTHRHAHTHAYTHTQRQRKRRRHKRDVDGLQICTNWCSVNTVCITTTVLK